MNIDRHNLTALDVAFSAAFREGFGQAPTDHERVRMEVPSTTKTSEYGWLGQFPGLKEWVGERTFRGIQAHGYSIQNRKFEGGISITRDEIEDDQHGLYAPMMMEMGRAAAAHQCELVFQTLKAGFTTTCYDGQYFFDTDHESHDGSSVANRPAVLGNGAYWFLLDDSRMLRPIIYQRRREYMPRAILDLDNEHVIMTDEFRWTVDGRGAAGYGLWQLAYGSRQPLTAAAYQAAKQTMREIQGDQGRPMGVSPTVLITSPANEHAGKELLVAERLNNGETNVWRGDVDLVTTSWLA